MSAYLQKRLEEHRLKLRKAELSIQFQAILARIDSLTFVEFQQVSNEDDIDVAFHSMVAIDAQPSSVLSLNVPNTERLVWLDGCLQQAGIQEECYIKFNGFHIIPWAKVRIPSSSTWLVELWQLPDIQEFLILRSDTKRLLYVSEEEYRNEAYVHELA